MSAIGRVLKTKDPRPKTKDLRPKHSSINLTLALDKFKLLTVLRHFYVPTKLLLDVAGHRICCLWFTMRQKRARGNSLHAFKPMQNLFPISVGREATNLC